MFPAWFGPLETSAFISTPSLMYVFYELLGNVKPVPCPRNVPKYSEGKTAEVEDATEMLL